MAHYGKFVGTVSEDGDTADQGDGDRDRMGQEHHEDVAETDGAEGVHCIPGRDEGKRILSVIEAGRGGGVRDEQLFEPDLQRQSGIDGQYAGKKAGHP